MWLCTQAAAAQDDKARARVLFTEGVETFDRGDFSAALQSFKQAYRLAPHPAVRVNMANCFEQLGQYIEAIFNYQRFLAESGSNVDPAQRERGRACDRSTRAAGGALLIVLEPSDASLSIDDAPAGRGVGGSVQLSAGRHVLRATKPGYEAFERIVEVEGGREQRVSLQLLPDQEAIIPGPLRAAPSEVIEESAPPPAEQPPAASSHRPLLWAGVGTTVVFLAGFGVTGVLALKAQQDFDDAVTRTNDAMADPMSRTQARTDGFTAADRADVYATVSDVLIGGALIAGTTTLIWWLVDRKRSRSEGNLQAGASLLQRGTGQLVLQGQF